MQRVIASLPLIVALLLPGLALIFTWLHHARARDGRVPPFRSLTALSVLQVGLRRVTESGRAIHVATGANRPQAIGPTAETVASLLVTQRVAEETAQRNGNLAVSAGDISAYAAARGLVHQSHEQTALAGEYQPQAIQMVAHQTPIAYAAGVAARYRDQPFETSVLVGDYDAEALLIAEEGASRGVPQVAGATTMGSLPVLALSTDGLLVGEELFAAEAYLTNAPTPRARLLTQDALRRAVVVIVLLGILYQLANFVFNLGLPLL